MASQKAFPTNWKINCPSGAKPMLLKNYKDHCRLKHTMTSETIQEKYDELKTRVEHSRAESAGKTRKVAIDGPIPVEKSNLFSMKRFALMKQAGPIPRDDEFRSTSNLLQRESGELAVSSVAHSTVINQLCTSIADEGEAIEVFLNHHA